MPSRTKTLIFGSFEHSSGDGNPVPHKNKPSWHKRIKRPIISNRRSKAIYSAGRRRTNCSPPDDCITFILNYVKQSGCNGFADDEIYSLAMHYYDEDDIDIGKPLTNCKVVVNHTIVLTEEEKAEARRQAMQKATDEAYRKITQGKNKTKKAETATQSSLF